MARRPAPEEALAEARIKELKHIRRLVDRTWATHGGVGGGMAHLIDVIDRRIRRIKGS